MDQAPHPEYAVIIQAILDFLIANLSLEAGQTFPCVNLRSNGVSLDVAQVLYRTVAFHEPVSRISHE